MFENYDEILTVDETCELLKMGRGAVYQFLKEGQLKGVRNGRVWRIPRAAVIEFVRSAAHLL